MLFGRRLDERIERLEEQLKEPGPERAEPTPPEEFLDGAWWGKLRETAGEDESDLARLRDIREFVELQLDAFNEGRSWRECATAIENFMLPERLALDRRRWEENSFRELGYVPGNNCEDCGRSGDRSEPCEHCGGVLSWHGYLHKRIWTIDKLARNIEATRRLAEAGYGGDPARLEGILERRMAER